MMDLSDTDSVTSKIKSVHSKQFGIKPVIINVDGRPLPEEELERSECTWYENDSDHKKLTVVLEDTEKNNYEGSLKSNVCRTMLVLRNKRKNKIKLIEVSECQLQKVLHKPTSQSNYDNDDIGTTYEENRNKLLKQFGSKKANRVSEIGSKMKINSEMMNSQIKNTAADVSVDVAELKLADVSTDNCLPICHRDATNLEGVYRYEDFFTESEWASMEEEAFVIMNVMPFTQEESGCSKLIIDYLDRLGNRVTIDKIKCLLFVDVLIKFFNCPKDRFFKRDIVENVCSFSNPIAKKVYENFTMEGKGGRIRNVTMDDKVVIHILILIIIACEYSCNTDELSRYLPRFSVKKIKEIARALCLSTKDKITWFLKLPLPTQKSAFMRKRRN